MYLQLCEHIFFIHFLLLYSVLFACFIIHLWCCKTNKLRPYIVVYLIGLKFLSLSPSLLYC